MRTKSVSKQDALKQFLADPEEFYRAYYVVRGPDGPLLKVNGALPIASLLSNNSDFTFYIEVKPVRIEFETVLQGSRGDTGYLEYTQVIGIKPGTKVKVTIEEIVGS